MTTGYGFTGAPRRARAYLVLTLVAALVLPWLVARGTDGNGPAREVPADWVAALVLVAVSGLNVELGRRLTGGLTHTQQPHKALSAWAFTCAMVLPTWWLLVVVPLTYAHARWRGLRVPLWK
ncbi:unannotated protein [freshwater metagenome]|uniref:Unannotated protein n=1 Tax=freshwater metagenome TaxID=449393 RepID=A0A6J6UXR8_9ZZZZ|nr:hypothetical protein [Actinomycetota bacterium]